MNIDEGLDFVRAPLTQIASWLRAVDARFVDIRHICERLAEDGRRSVRKCGARTPHRAMRVPPAVIDGQAYVAVAIWRLFDNSAQAGR
jgi:hypothetical protein